MHTCRAFDYLADLETAQNPLTQCPNLQIDSVNSPQYLRKSGKTGLAHWRINEVLAERTEGEKHGHSQYTLHSLMFFCPEDLQRRCGDAFVVCSSEHRRVLHIIHLVCRHYGSGLFDRYDTNPRCALREFVIQNQFCLTDTSST